MAIDMFAHRMEFGGFDPFGRCFEFIWVSKTPRSNFVITVCYHQVCAVVIPLYNITYT